MGEQLDLFTTDEEIESVNKLDGNYVIHFKSGTTVRIKENNIFKIWRAGYNSDTTAATLPNASIYYSQAPIPTGAATSGYLQQCLIWDARNDGQNNPPPNYTTQPIFPEPARLRHG